MNRLLILIVMYFEFYSCQTQIKSETDDNKVIGKYYIKETGEILFEIKLDTIGYYTLIANNGRKSTRDSFRLLEFKTLESKWSGFCGDSYDLWMSQNIIGGDDWKPNFNTGFYNEYNKFNFLSVKKGYISKEHYFLTGYCLINGSECFSSIRRINIDKLL